MIIRNYVKCSHCGAITMTRISIGHRSEETFSFECKRCFQPISGKLLLNQQLAEINGLSFKGAELVEDMNHDFVFNYHPDFPTPSTDPHSLLSPFLDAAMRHGEELSERTSKYKMFCQAVEESTDLIRLIRSYQAKKWDSFSSTIKEFDITKNLPLEKDIDKNRALYQILEIYLMPLVVSDEHTALITHMMTFLIKTRSENEQRFREMLDKLVAENILSEIQNSLLSLYPRFFEMEDEFRPVIMEWNSNRPDTTFPHDVKIEGRSGFEALKTFYVDAYEVLARGITLLMGTINLSKRNDFDLFLAHPDPTINKGRQAPFARSLLHFHKGNNGAKWAMLYEDQALSNWLEKALNPKLRNAIGHNTITYDPQTGEVYYFLDKERTQRETLMYGDFLFTVLRTFIRSHQMNHFVKMLYVHHYTDFS